MSERKSYKRSRYIERSEREIVALARLILRLLSTTINILIAIEELKKFFPRLQLIIVDDDLLPTAEAHANPKRWIIKIRRSIYDGLLRGSVRGRWTLVHELGHVLLQHPGRPARDPSAVENARTRAGRREREADKFTRSILMPFDRFSELPLEQIIRISGASQRSAERRIIEFAEAKAIREAVWRRGLDTRTFTSEFAHRPDLERQTAVIAQTLSEVLQSGQEEASNLIEPIKGNLFSTSVLVAAASGLLLDAYESLQPGRHPSRYTAAAALAMSILAICPLRPIGARTKQKLTGANLQCASKAALRLAGLPPVGADGLPFLHPQHKSPPYDCDFLQDVRLLGERLIQNPSTVLTLENFPTYEIYNVDHDIRWDDVHELDYLASYILVLTRSSKNEVSWADYQA